MEISRYAANSSTIQEYISLERPLLHSRDAEYQYDDIPVIDANFNDNDLEKNISLINHFEENSDGIFELSENDPNEHKNNFHYTYSYESSISKPQDTDNSSNRMGLCMSSSKKTENQKVYQEADINEIPYAVSNNQSTIISQNDFLLGKKRKDMTNQIKDNLIDNNMVFDLSGFILDNGKDYQGVFENIGDQIYYFNNDHCNNKQSLNERLKFYDSELWGSEVIKQKFKYYSNTLILNKPQIQPHQHAMFSQILISSFSTKTKIHCDLLKKK